MKIKVFRRRGTSPSIRLLPETEAERFQLAHVLAQFYVSYPPPPPGFAGHAGLYIVVEVVAAIP